MLFNAVVMTVTISIFLKILSIMQSVLPAWKSHDHEHTVFVPELTVFVESYSPSTNMTFIKKINNIIPDTAVDQKNACINFSSKEGRPILQASGCRKYPTEVPLAT